MFETNEQRHALFVRMQAYLSTLSGPLRLERIPMRLWGVEWSDLSFDDRHVLCGVVARLGWTKRWPHWFAPGHDPQQAGQTPIDAPAAIHATPDAETSPRAA